MNGLNGLNGLVTVFHSFGWRRFRQLLWKLNHVKIVQIKWNSIDHSTCANGPFKWQTANQFKINSYKWYSLRGNICLVPPKFLLCEICVRIYKIEIKNKNPAWKFKSRMSWIDLLWKQQLEFAPLFSETK